MITGRGGRGWRTPWQDCLALLVITRVVHDLLFSSFAGVRMDGSNATIIGSRLASSSLTATTSCAGWTTVRGPTRRRACTRPQRRSGIPAMSRVTSRISTSTVARGKTQPGRRGAGDRAAHRAGCYPPRLHPGTSAGSTPHRALQRGRSRNILLEGADWNDGMDMARERGESVAFTVACGQPGRPEQAGAGVGPAGWPKSNWRLNCGCCSTRWASQWTTPR